MILSDLSIVRRICQGSLVLEPAAEPEQVQPASLDVRLGHEFRFFSLSRVVIDSRDQETINKAMSRTLVATDGAAVKLEPGEFLLATTLERIKMPNDLVARVEGRSSIGRLGVCVHVTAGFIDPGFEGRITLEISNMNRHPVILYVGQRIAQLAFEEVTPVGCPYGHPSRNSKYQGQDTTTPSRMGEEGK